MSSDFTVLNAQVNVGGSTGLSIFSSVYAGNHAFVGPIIPSKLLNKGFFSLCNFSGFISIRYLTEHKDLGKLQNMYIRTIKRIQHVPER